MHRDMDLIRKMLIVVADHKHGFAPDPLIVEGYSEEQIGYHAFLMIDAGLALGVDACTRGDESPMWTVQALTWDGHEFLDAAREPGRWAQAKALIDKVGGASLTIWTSVLTEIVKSNLGVDGG